MYQRSRGGGFAVLLVITFVLVGGICLYYSLVLNRDAEVTLTDDSLTISVGEGDTETESRNDYEERRTITVHVTGEVEAPGVYELPEGSRVIDAIQAAGGVTSDADTERINLAAYVADAEQVIIPKKGESEASVGDVGGKININTASADELEELPGIGPSKAAAIVKYRGEHGPFRSIRDIMNVPGIGEATFSLIQDRIRTY